MKKHNASNERVKRQYLCFLKEAKRQSEATIDSVAKAFARFEEHTDFRDFKRFHREQAISFKRHLAEVRSCSTSGKLSKSTMHATLAHLKRFFEWLAMQPGYKSRVQYTDAEYFNLSENDTRIATARRERPYPTLKQVKSTLAGMPQNSEIENRNRALVAFSLLTGARDSAIASAKLKHVDIEQRLFFQDARDVKTKFRKSFPTYFFPVGDEVLKVFDDWLDYLRRVKLYVNEDPLFPSTNIVVNENQRFEPGGISREHWKNTSAIRKIFRASFEAVNLPYFNPHSIRKTLVEFGSKVCQTPQEFKAWSQNLGHEGVLTTFDSYGYVNDRDQREIILGLDPQRSKETLDIERIAEAVARQLKHG